MNIPPSTEKKPAIKWNVIKRLLPYLFAHKPTLFSAFALMLISSALSLAGPSLSGKAIAALEGGKGNVDFKSVFFFCALMAVFYIASALLSYLLSIVMLGLSKKISFTMRKQVFEHLLSLPVGYFDKNQTGDIISRISYDVDTVNASLSSDLLQICTSAVTIIGSFVMMCVISPKLILVFAVTLPLSIWFIQYRARKVKPLFRKRSAKLGELNGFAEEMLSGQNPSVHTTVKKLSSDASMKKMRKPSIPITMPNIRAAWLVPPLTLLTISPCPSSVCSARFSISAETYRFPAYRSLSCIHAVFRAPSGSLLIFSAIFNRRPPPLKEFSASLTNLPNLPTLLPLSKSKT